MSELTRSFQLTALASSAGALLAASAFAQESGISTAAEFGRIPEPGEPVWQVTETSGYDFAGAAHYGGLKLGDSDAYNYRLQASALVFLNKDWFLGLGLISDNFGFQQVTGAPVPADIHTLRFNVGLGYRLNDQWTLNALVSPSLYRLENVRGQDVGIAGGLLARYQASPTLTVAFGILGAPDSDVPAFPVIGVRWEINDRYTLEAGMPKTRILYHLEPKWSVYGGVDLNGAIFREGDNVGARFSPTQSRYDNALATYRDVRVGLGTSYEFAKGLRAEVEAGYSVYREIYFVRIQDHVRFDPAPYVRLAVSYRF